jgi:predicted ribonuclease toxin of YeeF-YezG toxin-antitoxin module
MTRREELRELSANLRPLVEKGIFDSLNLAIVDNYKKSENAFHYKRVKEWNEEGKRIKKGSKGFPVWGRKNRPKKEKSGSQAQQLQQAQTENEDLGFFPICYLFNEHQIE